MLIFILKYFKIYTFKFKLSNYLVVHFEMMLGLPEESLALVLKESRFV